MIRLCSWEMKRVPCKREKRERFEGRERGGACFRRSKDDAALSL